MSKNMSKSGVQPTVQEDRDFLAWISGEEVEFPYFKYREIVALPKGDYLDKRFI